MDTKKLKIAALKYEINTHLDEVLEVLETSNIIERSEMWFESRAYDWIESKPSEDEMDMILKKLGY